MEKVPEAAAVCFCSNFVLPFIFLLHFGWPGACHVCRVMTGLVCPCVVCSGLCRADGSLEEGFLKRKIHVLAEAVNADGLCAWVQCGFRVVSVWIL